MSNAVLEGETDTDKGTVDDATAFGGKVEKHGPSLYGQWKLSLLAHSTLLDILHKC